MTNKMVVRKKRGVSVGAGVGTLVVAPLALAAGWIAYSTFGINHAAPLPKAIHADQKFFVGRSGGGLAYYADTRAPGRPLVLIHSINAAGSAYEMRPLFDHYRTARPVYALDLPGFGFSERADRIYGPQLFEDAIVDFLETQVGQPADVIALSLGSEFAARAARTRPEFFQSLTMISPSGFAAEPREMDNSSAYQALSYPLWGRPLYDLIASRSSIQWFLQQSFEGPVDQGMIDYDYATAHQPGAHYAPLYFISGKLFTPDIRTSVYNRLTLPVLVLFDRDYFVSFAMLPATVKEHPNWRAVRVYPTRGLPQFEKLDEVTAALDSFWKESV
ncbi:MAG: alpha/beta fold hydrolase [Anaerolineae bacterium]